MIRTQAELTHTLARSSVKLRPGPQKSEDISHATRLCPWKLDSAAHRNMCSQKKNADVRGHIHKRMLWHFVSPRTWRENWPEGRVMSTIHMSSDKRLSMCMEVLDKQPQRFTPGASCSDKNYTSQTRNRPEGRCLLVPKANYFCLCMYVSIL